MIITNDNNTIVSVPRTIQEQQVLYRRPYILLLKHSLQQQQQSSLMNRYNDDISKDTWKQYQSQQQQQQSQQQSQQQPWLQCNELWLEYIATTIFEQQQQHLISVQTTPPPPSTTLPSTTTKNIENAVPVSSILYLSTLPNTTKKITSTINILQSKYGINRIHVIPIHTIGSIMNNDDMNNDETTSNNSTLDLDKLDRIISAIQNYFKSSISSSFTTIMIDSLTPILIRHGYNTTIQFIQQIITVIRQYCMNSFLVVPIRIEILSLQQLHTFEDSIHVDAILNVTSLNDLTTNIQQQQQQVIQYNMNHTISSLSSFVPINTALLLRRGVQQRDHIRRDIIYYTFNTISVVSDIPSDTTTTTTKNNNNSKETTTTITTHPIRRYQIQCITVDQNNDSNNTNDNADGTVSTTTTTKQQQVSSLSLDTVQLNYINNNDYNINDTTTSAISSLSISNNNHQQRRTMNIQMNDGQRIGQSTNMNTSTTISSSSTIINNIKQQPQKVPNIYMQDDDPEFINHDDDYDEEDPDDDLDL